jgi:hypothetical protein
MNQQEQQRMRDLQQWQYQQEMLRNTRNIERNLRK